MPIDTSIASVSTFPHPPSRSRQTSGGSSSSPPPPTTSSPSARRTWTSHSSTPGTDGPTDGQASNAGDYTIDESGLDFAGNTSAGSRSTPGIPLGSGSAERPKYLGISSTSGCTVLVWQLGGTP